MTEPKACDADRLANFEDAAHDLHVCWGPGHRTPTRGELLWLVQQSRLAEAMRKRSSEPNKDWDFWSEIVCDASGDLIPEKVQAELHDYGVLLRIVAQVYDHVTGGRVSKPFTLPESVCSVADEHYAELHAPEKEEPGTFLLLSLKHSRGELLTWWRPNASGYCQRLDWAGRYTEEEALLHHDGDRTVAVPVEEVVDCAHATTVVRFTSEWGVPVSMRDPADEVEP